MAFSRSRMLDNPSPSPEVILWGLKPLPLSRNRKIKNLDVFLNSASALLTPLCFLMFCNPSCMTR